MRNLGIMRVVGVSAGVGALCWLYAAGPTLRPAHARGAVRSGGGSKREVQGVSWTGEPGITETVAEIMERERRAPVVAGRPRAIKAVEREFRRQQQLRQNPAAQPLSRWPKEGPELAVAAPRPYNPQPVGTSFLGVQFVESGFIPPDSMGDVGPSQVLVAVNGRIKVFDKLGNLGSLNAAMDTFFPASIRGGVNCPGSGCGTSDPHVRYDRLSGRWFITILTVPLVVPPGGTKPVPTGPNRVLIAVSSGSTITSASSFTFFQFQQDMVGSPGTDLNGFADYDTLGVDNNALYIGVNIFDNVKDFIGTTGFVVRKASLLGGTLSVTAFRQISAVINGTTCVPGPFAPQGVNNDDPSAGEGYFIGVDLCFFSTLQVRRVINPGSFSPSISGNLTINTPSSTVFPIDQPQPPPGMTLDSIDDRLFGAMIHNNKITGASTLWAAQNIEVNTGGVATMGGGRNGSRWYEIGSLTSTPAVIQSGTLFDSSSTNPLGYWMPSVTMSGQGHMVLGASRAGADPANGYASVAVAGRLRTDAAGTIQSPTLAQSSTFVYNLESPAPMPPPPPERWGDYSQTVVDPNDDMTMWTLQEYTNATDSWGVRVVKLVAPPPATPNCGSPAVVTTPTQSVTITGTSSNGSEFFDPGSGYASRLTAMVSGGTNVNSVTFNNPTSVTLNITTTSNGLKDVTLTNPDGQSVVGTGCITVMVPADLNITKTDGRTSTGAGSPVTYTITVGNAGPGGANGATVADNFPASLSGVTWTCSASAGSSCGAASGSGNINTTVNLPAGGTATFMATGLLDINATGTLSNTATVTPPAGTPDNNLSNNTATDTDTIIPAADLSITKSDGQTTVSPGMGVWYTIVATNSGPTAVTGATVSDTVPAGLTGAAWTCTPAGGATCTASGTGSINDTINLPVGATATYTLSGNVTVSLTNTATITAPATVNDPNLANNTASDTDLVVCGSVTIVVPDGRLSQATVASGATAWFGASLRIGDSYSVEIQNVGGTVAPGTLTVYKGDDACNASSTLTTNDTSAIDPSGTNGLLRQSFTAVGTQTFFQAKLVNNTGGPVTVTFGWSDTTMFSPAWSTFGTFDTFYSFQNTTGAALSGTLTLLDTNGNVLSTFPLSVPVGQTAGTNTSALGVTRNRAGTARFVHNGPPGAIVAETAIANFNLSPAYVQPVKFKPVRDAR